MKTRNVSFILQKKLNGLFGQPNDVHWALQRAHEHTHFLPEASNLTKTGSKFLRAVILLLNYFPSNTITRENVLNKNSSNIFRGIIYFARLCGTQNPFPEI